MWGNAVSDAHGTIEDMVAEGDKVACRCSFRGIHKGDLMGIAATGKQITLTGIVIYRIVDGRIQEEWDYSDTLGLMQQLGVGPQLARPTE
jgi:predicted ester cyclase